MKIQGMIYRFRVILLQNILIEVMDSHLVVQV